MLDIVAVWSQSKAEEQHEESTKMRKEGFIFLCMSSQGFQRSNTATPDHKLWFLRVSYHAIVIIIYSFMIEHQVMLFRAYHQIEP